MAKLLIAAQDLATGVLKGDIVEVYPDSYTWGNKESLPNFIRASISDKTKEQIDIYLSSIYRIFNYTINNQNANGVRATVAIDTSVSGTIDLSVKQEVKDFILSGAGALDASKVTLHAQTPESLTVNIAIPDDGNRTPTLQAIKFNVNNFFSEVIGYRRFQFESGAVDSVISSGGEWSGTAVQAASAIVDRLA